MLQMYEEQENAQEVKKKQKSPKTSCGKIQF